MASSASMLHKKVVVCEQTSQDSAQAVDIPAVQLHWRQLQMGSDIFVLDVGAFLDVHSLDPLGCNGAACAVTCGACRFRILVHY